MGMAEGAGRLTLAKFSVNPIYYISTIDCIHDFKTYLGKDRPNQKRNDDTWYYWTGFKNYIMAHRNKGSTINPEDALIFNGCNPIIPSATIEDIALELSKRVVTPIEIEGIGYDSANKPAFYTAVRDALAAYRVAGVVGDPRVRIPIVIDTEHNLNKARTTLEFVDYFAVCYNKENIADPGQSFLRDFGPATVREEGDEARIYSYPEYPIDSRLGPIRVSGTIDLVGIDYGGVIAERYNAKNRVYPNSKPQAQAAFEALIKSTAPYGLAALINYCADFTKGSALPGAFSTAAVLAQLTAHLIKKRFGDQLQVLSCIRQIRYITSRGARVAYGGRERPCVFWSYDRVAIGYAILLGIPCVYELANGRIQIILPNPANADIYAGIAAALGGVQEGGACTRADVRDFSRVTADGIKSSTPFTDAINEDITCMNRYIELHFETTSVYFHPINCIQFIRFLHDSGRKGGIDVNMFHETYATLYYNDFPQLYIEGDSGVEDRIVQILRENPYMVFYSYKYKIWIAHREHAGSHTFEIHRVRPNGSTQPADLIYRFNQGTLLSFGDPIGYAAVLEGGGTSSRKKEDPVIHFLSTLSAVEKKFLLLSDNRELFTAELKTMDVPSIGYTCYDLIFFVLALVKKLRKGDNNRVVTESVGALFDILKQLKEDTFAKELTLFLNMYSKYKHEGSHSHTSEHVGVIQRLLERARRATKKMEVALSRMKDDSKMVKFIHKNLPLGILTRQYAKVQGSSRTSARVSSHITQKRLHSGPPKRGYSRSVSVKMRKTSSRSSGHRGPRGPRGPLGPPGPPPPRRKSGSDFPPGGPPGPPRERTRRFHRQQHRPRTARPRTARPRTARPRTARPRTARPRTARPRPRTATPSPWTATPRTATPRLRARDYYKRPYEYPYPYNRRVGQYPSYYTGLTPEKLQSLRLTRSTIDIPSSVFNRSRELPNLPVHLTSTRRSAALRSANVTSASARTRSAQPSSPASVPPTPRLRMEARRVMAEADAATAREAAAARRPLPSPSAVETAAAAAVEAAERAGAALGAPLTPSTAARAFSLLHTPSTAASNPGSHGSTPLIQGNEWPEPRLQMSNLSSIMSTSLPPSPGSLRRLRAAFLKDEDVGTTDPNERPPPLWRQWHRPRSQRSNSRTADNTGFLSGNALNQRSTSHFLPFEPEVARRLNGDFSATLRSE